ncbi:hypothetical protein ANN_14693 [Periplaneta americana]|uniref:Transposase n=1 Tax=Periplaneta americana TaxID=6978 RepID=A0ABQ8SYH7_PERAM|nr:hypothetical protein ANN_14693 [Periplaneta americana]
MASRQDWTPSKRSRAVTVREEGYTFKEIARKLGNGATVSGVQKVWQSDGVKYVRRRNGEALNPECLIATMKHPVAAMIWGCMSKNGVGRLQIVQGNFNAEKYIKDILETKLIPSIADLHPNCDDFVFEQDGAPCHTAKSVMQWLQQKNIKSIPDNLIGTPCLYYRQRGGYYHSLLGVQFKVCHGSLYAVMWLVDEPREFNLPTLPQRCITNVLEKLPSKYGFSQKTGYTKWDHKCNEDVMEELQLESVINHVKHYQNNWINHLHRMRRDRIPKVMLHYRPNGKMSLGRPKKRWIENSTNRTGSKNGDGNYDCEEQFVSHFPDYVITQTFHRNLNNLVSKFRETGYIELKRCVGKATKLTGDLFANVKEKMQKSPHRPLKRLAAETGDKAGEMSPGSNTESYPAFAHIGLRENPGKNLNQVTCPDRESNPGHLVSRLDVLTVTPQVWTDRDRWLAYVRVAMNLRVS